MSGFCNLIFRNSVQRFLFIWHFWKNVFIPIEFGNSQPKIQFVLRLKCVNYFLLWNLSIFSNMNFGSHVWGSHSSFSLYPQRHSRQGPDDFSTIVPCKFFLKKHSYGSSINDVTQIWRFSNPFPSSVSRNLACQTAKMIYFYFFE